MDLKDQILELLREKLAGSLDDYLFPPPVFESMEGSFVALDLGQGTLQAEFPVLSRYLNPFNTLQGGILAAAVDNTLGPLSVLVAPPNVTRHLELTYSRPVAADTRSILVTAKFIRQEGRRLFFTADVRDPAGLRLVRAKAIHYIIEELPDNRG